MPPYVEISPQKSFKKLIIMNNQNILVSSVLMLGVSALRLVKTNMYILLPLNIKRCFLKLLMPHYDEIFPPPKSCKKTPFFE